MTRIRTDDLVLKVSKNVDPEIWDDRRYDAFVDLLCEGREYQKDALFTTLRFLAGDSYKDLRTLAKENYDENDKFSEAYGSWEAMEHRLQIADRLSCSLDLATGTGKSYVLYGLGAILLCEGVVDRVLVLCPSRTIEHGLTEKFRRLAGSADLQDAMPERVGPSAPRIINATESLVPGTICVENYHAVLKGVRSSVRDSLRGVGEHVLILNDEAHHVVSEGPNKRKKWQEFLLDDSFGFRRLVGVSGTCYIKNDYFADVVHRYSLRDAIEERQVKNIEYVTDGPSLRDREENWRFIHDRHRRYDRTVKRRLGGRRPLTIVVTKDIRSCETVAEDLRSFLSDEEEITPERADRKVLVVTSSSKHSRNVAKLRGVDDPQSPVEWIVSVSMLTEGWDVKSVFQIVPHEERAFNSKLLISQVLGRGLRIPDGWTGEQPVVTVLNHENWSGRIQHLVNEIMDVEKRVTSKVLPNSRYHFVLDRMEVESSRETVTAAPPRGFNLFERGFIELPFLLAEEPFQTTYERVRGKARSETVRIRRKTFTATQVAADMHGKLLALDRETRTAKNGRGATNYAVRYPLARLLKVVRESVQRAKMAEDAIPDEIRQKFLSALGALRRRTSGRLTYTPSFKSLDLIETTARQEQSCTASELRRGKGLFLHPNCRQTLAPEQRDFFDALGDQDGDYQGVVTPVENQHDFKTPTNLAIADSRPERRFIRRLIRPENAGVVDAWIKNAAMGFYAIEYAWSKTTSRPRGASHIKRGMFSPDFFIKQKEWRFVVEIKEDATIDDPGPENIRKHEFASRYFRALNERLESAGVTRRYGFNMLTPKDYETFFDRLRKALLEGYRSRLDAVILDHTDMPVSGRRFEEFDSVRLATDDYEERGWSRGRRGRIVEVYAEDGERRYGLEFDEYDEDYSDFADSISYPFRASELELVEEEHGE